VSAETYLALAYAARCDDEDVRAIAGLDRPKDDVGLAKLQRRCRVVEEPGLPQPVNYG
jgi:hypothetical protein